MKKLVRKQNFVIAFVLEIVHPSYCFIRYDQKVGQSNQHKSLVVVGEKDDNHINDIKE